MKQVLITGATGFIGGRLAELICEQDIRVVGLVHAWAHAANLSRLPVHMVEGNILSTDSLREAMRDCDVVFHCAIDNNVGGEAHQLSSVQGTINVMQTALELGVKRVVHLSSAAVHSYKPTPDAVVEEGMYRYSGDDYCDGKIDGEKAALGYWHNHGLPVTVLRPTIVYGPYGYQTVHTATIIREGRMVLINGGTGICNSLYVDNLVDAMLLAAEHSDAVGEVFHISDARPVSWKEFIEAHVRALGNSYLPLPEMTIQELEEVWGQPEENKPVSSIKQVFRLIRDPQTREALASIPILRRSVRMGKSVSKVIMPGPIRHWLGKKTSIDNRNGSLQSGTLSGPRPILSQSEAGMFTTFDEVAFRIDKARRILGYEPAIDFEEGMRRTAAWIQWARL